MKIDLLVIDPQYDFCDFGDSALPVKGANADMDRLAVFVRRNMKKIDDIHITMDSHRLIDIAHPIWWVNSSGKRPNPFDFISADDVANGIWTPRAQEARARSLKYTQQLEAQGTYKLQIWNPHCLIGTPGHNIHAALNEVLQEWSDKEFSMVNYVTKGSNPWTEHYGALMAEVPDPDDPTTSLNTPFLEMLEKADIVLAAGEALSHCLRKTVTQIADNIGPEHIKKFHILTDCTSSIAAVPGADFPTMSQQWLREMEKRGMHLVNSKDFLK